MEKIGNKSFYKKILKDTMLILVVPFCTSLLLWISTENIIYKLVSKSNKNILEHYFEVLDTSFHEMVTHSSLIINNDLCKFYANYAGKSDEKYAYIVTEMISLLNDFQYEQYQDLFVYYPGNGRVISGYHGSLQLDDYYSIFYKNNINGNQFYEMLESAKKVPSLYSLENSNGENILCVVKKKAERIDYAKEYVVVEVISSDYLKKIMSGNITNNGGILMLFGSEKEFLTSSEQVDVTFKLDNYSNGSSEEAYEIEIDNEKYMMQVKESGSIEGYFAYATPIYFLRITVATIRLISLIGNTISLLISVLVVYRISKRTYRPLGEIISKIEESKMVMYDPVINTEVEFVDMIFKDIINQGRKEEEKNNATKKTKFLMSLINGNIKVLDCVDNIFEENKITIYSDKFRIAILRVEKSVEYEVETRDFILSNVFEELCNRKDIAHVFKLQKNQYCVLVNIKEDSTMTENIVLFKEGIEYLKKSAGIIVSVAVGSDCNGMSLIKDSYEEAMMAMRYFFLYGEGTCVHFCQIQNRKFDYKINLESNLSLNFMDYIMNFNSERKAKEILEGILLEYEINETASMDTIDCFRFEVVSTLNKILINRDISEELRVKTIEKLLKESNFQGFKNKLTELIDFLRDKEKEKNDNKIDCEKVKEYIEAHYRNAGISVVMIGEALQVPSVEMSKIFRERYRFSVLDYIALVRVRSAKEDLKNTNKNIKTIAAENGFLSSTVFGATFKKIEGVTPGNYRELSRK